MTEFEIIGEITGKPGLSAEAIYSVFIPDGNITKPDLWLDAGGGSGNTSKWLCGLHGQEEEKVAA